MCGVNYRLKNFLIVAIFGILAVSFSIVYVDWRLSRVSNNVYYNLSPLQISVDNTTPTSFVSAVAVARQSVVEINVLLENGVSAGSGVIYSSDGIVTYIITNFHVVENGEKFKIILYNGDVVEDVQFVGGDSKQDIAVLMIKGSSFKLVDVRQITKNCQILLGETVFAIGNPLGLLGGSVTKGIISCLNREIKVDGRVMDLMQTDVAINSGNSGGGLFDEIGHLIGIVNAKVSATGVEGIAFAISIDNVLPIANELIARHIHNEKTQKVESVGYIKGRAWLGFEIEYLQKIKTANFYGGIEIDAGFFVSGISDDSKAYKSGIRKDDKFFSVYRGENEIDFESKEDFSIFEDSLVVGDELVIKFQRGNKILNYKVIAEQKIYEL